MSAPIPVPTRQISAFNLAMAKHLGLDPTEIVDDFEVNFKTADEDMTEVTFSGRILLPTDEVLAMFNGAGGASSQRRGKTAWIRRPPGLPRGVATMTLTDFLLEQIAEDKREYGLTVTDVQDIGPGQPGERWGFVAAEAKFNPRILANLEPHTRIVGWHGGAHECPREDAGGFVSDLAGWYDADDPCPTLRALALAYTDRPGFREEWLL